MAGDSDTSPEKCTCLRSDTAGYIRLETDRQTRQTDRQDKTGVKVLPPIVAITSTFKIYPIVTSHVGVSTQMSQMMMAIDQPTSWFSPTGWV